GGALEILRHDREVLTRQDGGCVAVGEEAASLERVEQRVAEPHQKVPGETDPFDLQPGTRSRKEIDQRERKRDAPAAGDHFWEEGVADFVIMLRVAMQAEFLAEKIANAAN